MKTTLKWILVCFVSLSWSISKAQQRFETLVDYNQYYEFPYSIYQVQDSGYIFVVSGAEFSSNTLYDEFNKLNKDGTVAYQKVFGFAGNQCYIGLSNSLKPTIDGGWIMGASFTTSLNHNIGMAVKYNSIGDTQFVKFFGDTSDNVFYDCIQTSDSGFVFVGDHAKYSPTINNDFWIVKTDSIGNVEWQQTLGTSKDDQAFVVIENSNHQLVVSGAKQGLNNIRYPYAAIYDLQGNLINTKSFNQGALLSGGAGSIWNYGVSDYIMLGSLDTVININDYSNPALLARLDSNFNFIWKAIYNAPVLKENAIGKKISDGGIVQVGDMADSLSGNTFGWISKVDSNGNKLWEHFYVHSTAYNYFRDFQETFDHGFIICGTTLNSVTNNQDSWIVKLDSNGCLDSNCVINVGTHEITYDAHFTVFPNPTKDQITVLISETKGELTLYDLLGKIISQQKTEFEKQVSLNLSNLTSGIYLLQFTTGNKVYTSKVVKE